MVQKLAGNFYFSISLSSTYVISELSGVVEVEDGIR